MIGLKAPFAAGDGTVEIPVGEEGNLLIRFVPDKDETITSFEFEAYGFGATIACDFYEVNEDGFPGELIYSAGAVSGVDVNGIYSVTTDFAVSEVGEELIAVLSGSMYFVSFLSRTTNGAGVAGANGRNERRADAPDALYGIDPREVVGYASSGAGFVIPTEANSAIPTYLVRYADGSTSGQPYVFSDPVPGGVVSTDYGPYEQDWTITHLGAFLRGDLGSKGVATVTVDEVEISECVLSGSGMVRFGFPEAILVRAGSTVSVSVPAGASGVSVVAVESPWDEYPEHKYSVYLLPDYAPTTVIGSKDFDHDFGDEVDLHSPKVVTVTGEHFDTNDKVEFWVDDEVVGTGFEFTVSPDDFALGSHVLWIKTYDDNGNIVQKSSNFFVSGQTSEINKSALVEIRRELASMKPLVAHPERETIDKILRKLPK